jgi:hypothetical protein
LIGYALIGQLTDAGLSTFFSICIVAAIVTFSAFVIALGPERWIARRMKAGLKRLVGAARGFLAKRTPRSATR